MVEKKSGPMMAHDNHIPQVVKKNFTPQAAPQAPQSVQGNHVPTTGEKPSAPPPSPKKK
jgi:hypothetical protein